MNKINFLRIICITTFVVSMVMSIILCLPGNWDSADASTTDEVKSKAYCLMDYGTGEVLLEKESKQHLPIASVTKTMTLLLTFEAIEQGKFGLEDMLLSTQNASGMGGSQVFLEPDTEYKVDDLLYAVIMSSANDASVVFAEAIAGSESAFVDMMNKKAQSLGLVDTNFVNCTGLPANNHYSCAHDVAVIMRELVGHQEYFNYTKERLRDFVHPTGRVTQMTNTNKLMRSYNGCDAGKTGSTVEAGYCLSATAIRNNMSLLSVVLGADNSTQRFVDCSTLFDYGFNNYESKCLVDTQQILYPQPVAHSKTAEIYVQPQQAFYQLTKRGEDSNTQVNFEYFKLSAPMKQGEVAGKIIVTKDNVVTKEIDLVLSQDIQAMNYYENIQHIAENW